MPKSDIEIAQEAKMEKIIALAGKQYEIPEEDLDPYGHFKAKLSMARCQELQKAKRGKLILVTAISPTPAGEGKTTTTVGLGDALNLIGVKAISCIREPSLGPCFGVKGGAAGGGHAQVVPMEDINLHFTGDIHAVTTAHNLLSALIDNHLHQGNELNLDERLIQWRRVLDMNDRALRQIIVGMGGTANGHMRADGFDISVASEVMAILCLSTSLEDLKDRLGRIIVGYTAGPVKERKPVFARDLNAHGAMAALLKDALKPNLVQSLENNITMIHGGPFANIAHGCNSVMATQAALGMADYVVTEAGFGADLGAEKFLDIKCRFAGLKPSAVVLVASVRALKYHGGAPPKDQAEDVDALMGGLCNLDKHLENITQHYGLPVVVCINHFYKDTPAEIECLQKHVQQKWGSKDVKAIVAKHWADGGKGAAELAKVVKEVADGFGGEHTYVQRSGDTLWEKISSVATKIYGAGEVVASPAIQRKLDAWTKEFKDFPVCIAKTQSSFSSDATKRGAPTGHTLEIREVRVSNGAGFVVAICGDIMTMPGLPKTPAAEAIDVSADAQITGLFLT
mmetsp:Transcript_2055/g.4077  ORF Transcript_2055/g.4077 Transcript_2055/m.4077 type:complete len:568 (+) Transcript_2055:78-1781(+)